VGLEESLARQMIHPGLTRAARRADLQPFLDVAGKFKFIVRTVNAPARCCRNIVHGSVEHTRVQGVSGIKDMQANSNI
jgi:hypothetical protein